MKLMLTGLLLMLGTSAQAADNMHLHGALVAEPCLIAPGDDSIPLDFGSVVNNDFYLQTRTKSKSFSLHLIDCDTSLANTLDMAFSGTEDKELKGLLALDSGSKAKGVAIGMETTTGTPLPLNKIGIYTPLTNGNMQININAYLQGQPNAISSRNIVAGSFIATATFTLSYQ